MTAKKIRSSLAYLPVTFIDGCIIGSAAKLSQDTALYVSGPDAAKTELPGEYGFTVNS